MISKRNKVHTKEMISNFVRIGCHVTEHLCKKFTDVTNIFCELTQVCDTQIISNVLVFLWIISLILEFCENSMGFELCVIATLALTLNVTCNFFYLIFMLLIDSDNNSL